MARVSIVGVGPGAPEYITPIARQTVENAQIVVGTERAVELFSDVIKGKKIKLAAKNLNATLKRAVESAKEGKTVVILSTGDPGFSGLLKTFLRITEEKNAEVNVIPGISSVQVCAARLLIPWDEVQLFTFHNGATTEEKEELAGYVKKGRTVMLLPDSKNFPPSAVANFLIGKGVPSSTTTILCENLTLVHERIVQDTLAGVSDSKFSLLCVMVIKPEK